MPLTFDTAFGPSTPRKRIRLSLPAPIHRRLEALRAKIEDRFRIRLGEEELVEYLCEKALERLEDWEKRTR